MKWLTGSNTSTFDRAINIVVWLIRIALFVVVMLLIPFAGVIDGLLGLRLSVWELFKLAMIMPIILHGCATLVLGLPASIGMGQGAWIGTLVLAIIPSSLAVAFAFLVVP